MKTLYVTDLDGTLLLPDGTLSRRTVDILRPLVRAGMALTYATARSFSSSCFVAQALGLQLPVFVHAGAVAVDPVGGTTLWRHCFLEGEKTAVARLFTQAGLYPLVYALIEGRERVSWLADCEKTNEGLRDYLEKRGDDPRLRRIDSPEALYEGEAFYFTCIGAREELAPIAARFQADARWRCQFQQELGRPECWCEVMRRDASKGQALRRLRQKGDYTRTVAFGDTMGDETLLAAADVGCAMQGAPQALIGLASHVLNGAQEDCVALWMENDWKTHHENRL